LSKLNLKQSNHDIFEDIIQTLANKKKVRFNEIKSMRVFSYDNIDINNSYHDLIVSSSIDHLSINSDCTYNKIKLHVMNENSILENKMIHDNGILRLRLSLESNKNNKI